MKTPRLILTLASLICTSVQGQTVLHWDADANYANGVSGHGITNAWNVTAKRWFDGVANVAWTDGSIAVFDGDTNGAANVFGSTFAPIAHSLVFSNFPGYRLSSAPAPKLTISSGNIYVYADATITANLTNAVDDITTGIRKLGPGRLTFEGNNNQAFGGLHVLEGTMVLDNKGGIGGTGQPLVVDGGTVELLNVENISGRYLNLGDSGATIHLPQATDSWLFQQNDGASGVLIKTGTGVLNLGNNNNGGTSGHASTRSGATVIEDGTLGAYTSFGSALGTGAVTVKPAGTLAGPGLVAGPVTVQGTISPSGSGITNVLALPNMTLAAGLDLSGGGTYRWQLLSPADDLSGSSRADFDRLTITSGSLVLGGTSTLSIEFGPGISAPDAAIAFWQQNHVWTIIELTDAANNPSATVFSALQNATYDAGTFDVSAGSNGSILLTYTSSSAPPTPPLIQSIVNQNTNVVLTWTSMDTREYEVESSPDLTAGPWTALTNVIATGTLTAVADEPGTANRFYRVVLLP